MAGERSNPVGEAKLAIGWHTDHVGAFRATVGDQGDAVVIDDLGERRNIRQVSVHDAHAFETLSTQLVDALGDCRVQALRVRSQHSGAE